MYPLTKKFVLPALAAGILVVASLDARAALILKNGNFAINGGAGQLTVNTTLSQWTGGGKEGNFGSQTTPPVFVFTPGSTAQLSTTGASGDAFMGVVDFYSATAAPDNGVVVAADGDPAWGGSISQALSGLTVGGTYHLAFNWAGAQQQNFAGDTTEAWQVSFGGSTQSTATVSTPSQTFAGWKTAAMDFTATSTSELLTFLAKGSPSGEPPWLLLDGVTLTQTTTSTPEPSAALLFIGGGILVGLRRRFKSRV